MGDTKVLKTHYAILLLLLFLTSGCSGMLGIGSSKYACPGYPDGATCLSAREVYELTDFKDSLEGYNEEDSQQGPHQIEHEPPMPSATTSLIRGFSVEGDIPVRTPAQVMRIWISPWVDREGNLHMPSYVFTEIEPRKWTFGEAERNKMLLLSPLIVE